MYSGYVRKCPLTLNTPVFNLFKVKEESCFQHNLKLFRKIYIRQRQRKRGERRGEERGKEEGRKGGREKQ